MRIIISALAVLILLGAATSSAFAYAPLSKHPIDDMLSGYYHGLGDAIDRCDPVCHSYIWAPGNGFINQTKEFIDGYVLGFCSIAGPNASMDEDEADFYCSDGLQSAGWMVGPTVRSGGVDFHRDPKLEESK